MNEAMLPVERPEMMYEKNAGTRIDTLEALLNAFSPYNAEAHAALRRELGLIRDEARDAGVPMVAAAATAAFHTETVRIEHLTTNLLALMRSHARASQKSRRPDEGDIDPVTGVMNRAAFDREFNRYVNIERAPVAVAVIRVDSFQSVRHRHGDDIASMLLAHVAELIQRQLRDADRLAHFGGDEFMLLLPGEDERGFHAVLARIEGALLNRPFRLPSGGGQETVRISSSGHQFIQTDPTAHGSSTDIAILRIGLAIRTPSIRQTVTQILRHNSCEPVATGRDAASRYVPFARHGAHLVILECDASDLPVELMQLRIALMHDRTPVLVLAANETAARWAIEHGANDALVKPVDLDLLRDVAIRLASRGHKAAQPGNTAPSPRVLVASDDLYNLIALGSALQKQGGYEVHLAHGSADAASQIAQCQPSTALIDLRLWRNDTGQFLQELARQRPGKPVVLITDKGEKVPVGDSGIPHIAGIIEKPVSLLALASEFRRATGIEPSNRKSEASEIFRDELLRVMRNSSKQTAAASA